MAVYSKILVAIDLSEEAHQVIRRAMEVAEIHGADIQVVHVEETPITGYGPMIGHPIGGEMQLREEMLAVMEKIADQHGLAHECLHCLLGHPATAINDLAIKLKASLIVVGSHGKHGIRLLLGSTANAILQTAPCDALLVKIVE
ncbi:MAG: universal stress protein [Pseudomonadales bacterium]|nr:universal stress protein [Pseudomonadales bacterium]